MKNKKYKLIDLIEKVEIGSIDVRGGVISVNVTGDYLEVFKKYIGHIINRGEYENVRVEVTEEGVISIESEDELFERALREEIGLMNLVCVEDNIS